MNFNHTNIWIITDGSQGMISQAKGLAQNFSNKLTNIKTNLIFPWSVLQPGFLPINKIMFKNTLDFTNKPEMIISCGRKSVYLSLYLKRILKNTITIHIQNPKVDFSKFDFIIAPNHDNIKGENVINSVGAIHQFTKNNIIENKNNFFIPKKNLVSFIIGGKNRHYNFIKKNILELVEKITKLKVKYPKFNFLIISSRRTGNDLNNILEKKLNKIAYVWDRKEKNPYIFALKYSKIFVVTSDSTSMISECAFTGKPIYVYNLPFRRKSKRMEYFHNEFKKLQITQNFSNIDKLKEWKYKSLDEAKRISGILKERIIKGF